MGTNIDSEAMVRAAQAGDSKAMEHLLREVHPAVYRFAINMCGHPEDAEEVSQDTLLAMSQQLGAFRGEASLTTWLYRIASRFCIKERRRKKHQPATEASIDDVKEADLAESRADAPGDLEHVVQRQELAAQLRRGLALLEPKYRSVVVLRDVMGLKSDEVADALELSVAAVKSRLHRGRTTLRDHMGGIMAAPSEPECPDLRMVFSRHLEGELDAAQCAQMESHLQSCPSCRNSCDCMKDTFALCREAGDAPIHPNVERSVRVALEGFLANAGCSAET